jgi:hypothetical protein
MDRAAREAGLPRFVHNDIGEETMSESKAAHYIESEKSGAAFIRLPVQATWTSCASGVLLDSVSVKPIGYGGPGPVLRFAEDGHYVRIEEKLKIASP